MSQRIPCFLIVPTGTQRQFLRRYADGAHEKCPGKLGYHNAMADIGEAAEKKSAGCYIEATPIDVYQDDPRWPVKCECGYVFSADDKDPWQVFGDSMFQRQNTDGSFGEKMALRDAPAGAMWNAWWLADFRHGPDGQCLILKMPGEHEWNIDGTASNCDSPCANCRQPKPQCKCGSYRDSRPHQCWIRHGIAPLLTVDKAGVTCGAGAGSILVPGWHGFLRNGVLEPC